MASAPRALIDHSALQHNLQRVLELAPHSRVWAVIKANAYGHGLLQVADSLSAADGLAVARIEEAVQLRKAGFRQPLLLLEGVLSAADLLAASRYDCQLACHQMEQVELLVQCKLPRPVVVWLKVDTGMHRLGFAAETALQAREKLVASENLSGQPGLMTHLANADNPADPLTLRQCERLRAVAGGRRTALSIANSAGVLAFPASRSDWVRPGIMLYGVSPFPGTTGEEYGLSPVMTLQARLIAINHCKRGDPIGYGGSYVCPEEMPVGVVGIGYGDGYPRHALGGTPVLVGDRLAPLVGRVSMDMITLDLRGVTDARVGDWVTLWGPGLPVEEVASRAGTIAYELLCRVSPRVEFRHQNIARNGQVPLLDMKLG